jgi:hypothetical protein
MPTTYAHYTFGMKVLKEIKGELREYIDNNTDLYNIGLHGPDILFYFKPLKSNKINELGNEIHKDNADIFFNNAKKVILSCDDFDKAFAYIAGFICHYMLDSRCHPYIRTKENRISHNEIETEFDRAIMLEDNLNPITFKPTSHIVSSIENAWCISRFFSDISPEEILKALKSMRFYLNMLVAPGKIQRALLISALRISGSDSKIGLIKGYSPIEECNETNDELMVLYNEAIKPCALLIEEYFNMCTNTSFIKGETLNEIFNRNFG